MIQHHCTEALVHLSIDKKDFLHINSTSNSTEKTSDELNKNIMNKINLFLTLEREKLAITSKYKFN